MNPHPAWIWTVKNPSTLCLTNSRKNIELRFFSITHNIHIVQEYADSLLALNKCVTYCGAAAKIVEPDIQRQIYGEPVCVETMRGER